MSAGIRQYKTLLLIVTVVAALFTASPVINSLEVAPHTACLTEFWALGPYHNATYPYNVTSGTDYRLYFDITNRLGSCAYYQIQVKFRNQTQSAPDFFNHTKSVQPSLGNISLIAANMQTVELPVEISFKYTRSLHDSGRLEMQSVSINGIQLDVNATVINWDSQRGAFLGNVFFELWLYNDTLGVFQYHERFVSLWLELKP